MDQSAKKKATFFQPLQICEAQVKEAQSNKTPINSCHMAYIQMHIQLMNTQWQVIALADSVAWIYFPYEFQSQSPEPSIFASYTLHSLYCSGCGECQYLFLFISTFINWNII
jgi:hypothetical protein